MSYDLRDGTVHAWAPTNHTPPATTWRQRLTQWRDRIYGPDPTGATSGWLTQMRTTASQLDDNSTGRHYADNIPTTLLRRPIAAIAATPHWPVIDDDLGPLVPGPLEPAHIHDHLIGARQ